MYSKIATGQGPVLLQRHVAEVRQDPGMLLWIVFLNHHFELITDENCRACLCAGKTTVNNMSTIFAILTHVWIYSIHEPGWLLKWLNLITAPGSVSNEPGSVTWLATNYLKTVSWRNHTEKLTTLWPQNISFWPKIIIPSSYFTILMLNCLENTLKLQFYSYVTAVKFLT